MNKLVSVFRPFQETWNALKEASIARKNAEINMIADKKLLNVEQKTEDFTAQYRRVERIAIGSGQVDYHKMGQLTAFVRLISLVFAVTFTMSAALHVATAASVATFALGLTLFLPAVLGYEAYVVAKNVDDLISKKIESDVTYGRVGGQIKDVVNFLFNRPLKNEEDKVREHFRLMTKGTLFVCHLDSLMTFSDV